jgi:F-type H+-transporting ATPase subunit gamma
MLGIKEYNQKITSLKSTKKITSAMKMIAATKLRRAQARKEESVPYYNCLKKVLGHLHGIGGENKELLLEGYQEVKKIHILVYSSDRGLCGSFNGNAVKKAVAISDQTRAENKEVSFSFIGRKAQDFFKRRDYDIHHYYEEVLKDPSIESIDPVVKDLLTGFTEGTYHEVYLIYNEFKSALSQRALAEKVLPMRGEEEHKDKAQEEDEKGIQYEYLFEPQVDELLTLLLPKLFRFQIFHALLDSTASEHGARMTAMDSATGNCSKLIDQYVLLRNRARQAAITTELTEIVAGKEAL